VSQQTGNLWTTSPLLLPRFADNTQQTNIIDPVSALILAIAKPHYVARSGGSRLPALGAKEGPEILEWGPGAPSGVHGTAPVGGLGDEVPQKPKHCA